LEVGLLWLDKGAAKLIAYLPAIAFAALLGGIGPGVMVALLGGLTAWLAFMPPSYSLELESYGDKSSLVTYGVISLLVAWVADYFGRLSKRLEDEEQLRELAVQELAHRLKNKIATIQAIISVQLRDSPQVRDGILDRLTALTVTDHLIEKANGQGAYIRDIASTELSLRRQPAHINNGKFRFDLSGVLGNLPTVHLAFQIDVGHSPVPGICPCVPFSRVTAPSPYAAMTGSKPPSLSVSSTRLWINFSSSTTRTTGISGAARRPLLRPWGVLVRVEVCRLR
jgi:Domain of unknown function (DUF4118)/HWE histidine kinase